VLDQGRIMERGQHGDLLKSHGIYKTLWNSLHDDPAPAPPLLVNL
jgi:ABC-type multidrug transport system fused ATPase/permease subunit